MGLSECAMLTSVHHLTRLCVQSSCVALMLGGVWAAPGLAQSQGPSHWRDVGRDVAADYREFYSPSSLKRLGLGFGLGAIAANTTLDESFQRRIQDDARSSSSDSLARAAKNLGEAPYALGLAVSLAGIAIFDNTSSVGRFGYMASRAYAVGVPAMAFSQWATGASRPGEAAHGSEWRPFKDSNGVSGHAFYGAVPFLVLARMNEDRPWLKWGALAASGLTAWSRVNDNVHYPSQAVLGWYVAYESVNAVFSSGQRAPRSEVMPWIAPGMVGVRWAQRW
jgi:hypothetical protein